MSIRMSSSWTASATLVLALGALAGAPAFAAGTSAGTEITNTASIAYNVNSVTQTALTSSDKITVDRVINFTAAATPLQITVTPGQTAFQTIRVTNLSNAPLSFEVSSQNIPDGTTLLSGNKDTWNIGMSTTTYYDQNGNGTYDAGTDTATPIPTVAPDTSLTVFKPSNTSVGTPSDTLSGVQYVIRPLEPGTATRVVATPNTTANTAGVDTVFAEPADGITAANNGRYDIQGEILIKSAVLTVTRTSTVISNGVEGATNPKVLPNAIVEHCVIVSNAAGAVSASNVAVADTFPSTVRFVAFSFYVGGTVTDGVCNADGTLVVGATPTAGQVAGTSVITGTIGTLPAGEARTIRYLTIVN